MIAPLKFPNVLVKKKYSNQEFSSCSIAWSSEWRIILFHNNDYTYNCDIIVSNFNGCALKITRKKVLFFRQIARWAILKIKMVQKILVISMAKSTNPCQLYRKAIHQFQNNFPKIFGWFFKVLQPLLCKMAKNEKNFSRNSWISCTF